MSEIGDAINRHIPLFFYEVHYVDEQIYGSLVDHKPAWEAERDYNTVYHFNGSSANYWIGTNERGILRDEALSFAVAVHAGRVRRFQCDLTRVSR